MASLRICIGVRSSIFYDLFLSDSKGWKPAPMLALKCASRTSDCYHFCLEGVLFMCITAEFGYDWNSYDWHR